MKNIIISLECATERRNHIYQQFNGHGLCYSFFDALVPDVAKIEANILNINYDNHNLTDNEFACLMSHVSLWKKWSMKKSPTWLFLKTMYIWVKSQGII